MLSKIKIVLAVLVFTTINCSTTQLAYSEKFFDTQKIVVGAEQMSQYLPMLRGKSIAMLVNQTSTFEETHLVDTLHNLGINIKAIFAPEHGFRGKEDAGAKIEDGKDSKTGIPIISIYGKKKKPSAESLTGIDLVVFDIQDVGARFYTYISSMHYVMEACAENNVDFMVLDRPNPNGHYVDGPIREHKFKSFVGLHPIPVVHGMTVGEYAQMINGQGWLAGGKKVKLDVVLCKNYDHKKFYELPVKPSPNLPNIRSIYLYPSLCFFEGTAVSVGRGTDTQFQVYGHPKYPLGVYEFKPIPMPGAKYPKHKDQLCKGYSLVNLPMRDLQKQAALDLNYVIGFYRNFPDKDQFFNSNNFFDLLAGTDQLRKQIQAGKSEAEIRASWEVGLEEFKKMRKEYLLYKD
ncbi:MAG: DUF1343 domain-containing protein [Bacteroidota bacterium]